MPIPPFRKSFEHANVISAARSTKGIIIVVAILVAAGSNLGAVILVTSRYNGEMRDAHAYVRMAADLVAIQTGRTFQALDLAQKSVKNYLESQNVTGTADLRNIAASNGTYEYFRMLEKAVSPLQGLMITDANGDIIAISRHIIPLVSKKYNVSDRDYFSKLASSANDGIYIDGPLNNRYDGSWTIPISYRIESKSERFIGIINCAVPLSYFEDSFRGIASTSNAVVRLYRADGSVVASSIPGESQKLNRTLGVQYSGSHPLDSKKVMLWPGQGSSPHSQIAAVGAVERVPLFVQVSVPRNSVLAFWYREALTAAIIDLFLDISVAVAAILALRQIRSSTSLAKVEWQAARHDFLTRLPNRACFQEEIDRACQQTQQNGNHFALLLLDLDGFKQVNDTLGHRAGDQLLCRIGGRLKRNIKADVFLARLGGDEFAIIQPSISGAQQAHDLGCHLIEILSRPFYLNDNRVMINVSIGIAISPCDGVDRDTLFDNADLALYQAKSLGRGMLCRFSKEIRVEEITKLAFVEDLRAAVDNQQFDVFFQPIVDLQTRQIAGFEALLRWNDPERGAVAPAQFIPVAEETGLIGPLGAWVLLEACRRAATWPTNIYVAVNLSPVQLRICDVYEQVRAALESSALPARRLVAEITETVRLTTDGAGGVLHRLRDMGVGVSLDDFGTGYASLSYLQSFPFDRIKIDQSFIRAMDSSSEAASIVITVVELARRLGFTVTGEGIETFSQLEKLRMIGCAKGQGYLIGRPMPAGEVCDFIQNWVYPDNAGTLSPEVRP